MAIKFRHSDGTLFEVDTPEEAVTLRRMLAVDAAERRRASESVGPATGSSGASPAKAFDREVAEMALNFLRTIEAKPEGVKKEAIMASLHVNNAKAIGSRSARINAFLSDIGYPKANVYSNPKRPPHGRTWRPERGIRGAVSKIATMLRET